LRPIAALFVSALLLFLSTGCAKDDHPGRPLFERACARCHSLDKPLAKRKDPAEWERTVAAMRQRGARLNDEEARLVVEYLVAIRPAP